jgi:hypothetical protein
MWCMSMGIEFRIKGGLARKDEHHIRKGVPKAIPYLWQI